MHIVYLIKFVNLEHNDLLQHLYIGSKSNCNFINGKIIDSNGKYYYGSSEDGLMKHLILTEEMLIEKLYSSDIYEEVLRMERDIHIINDVVADTRYFNKSIATINTYTNPDYATYKHIITGKCVRLPRTHPMVLSSEYVGVTSGFKVYNNGEIQIQCDHHPGEKWIEGILESNRLYGDLNGFHGKKHTKESIEQSLNSRKRTYDENPDIYEKVIKILTETCSKTFKGIPLSDDRRLTMKGNNKDRIVLKNMLTGDCIQIHRDKSDEYDKELWISPYAYSRIAKDLHEIIICPHCLSQSDKGNSAFMMWHFDNCRKNPVYIDDGYDITCTKCNKMGKSNNRGFVGHHFNNCVTGLWLPWKNRNCSQDSLLIYSKLNEIYEFLRNEQYCLQKSKKKIFLEVKKVLGFTETNHLKYFIRTCISKIIDDDYNPKENLEWLKFKKEYDNENNID